MRVIDEHECKYLKNQNHNENDIIAVQEMVEDVDFTKVKYLGWYLVNYRTRDRDIALGIRCCPYCGVRLRKEAE